MFGVCAMRFPLSFSLLLFCLAFFPVVGWSSSELSQANSLTFNASERPDQQAGKRFSLDDVKQALEDVLHYVNEIGALIRDFWRLILQDPLKGLLELVNFLGELLGVIDSGDGVAGLMSIPGPGLGNLDYTPEQVFSPVGWINQETGVPGIYPGRKPFGTNLGMMIDGYFFTLFAPDSGKGPGGFLFLDVSNPTRPKLIRRIYEPDGRTAKLREPHSFGLARIHGRRYMAFQSTIGVEFWDFTDLNNLQKVAELDLPQIEGGDYSNVAWQLSWQAPYLYVAASEQGIFIVDASDPANPVIADRGPDKPNPIPPSELGGFRVGPIFTFGNQLVISSMENRDGISSLDISDPLNPQLLSQLPALDQFYYATCFNGRSLAVSVRGADARMELYDISHPERIGKLSDNLLVPGQLYCAFQDDVVFQGAEDRMHKIDISNPLQPQELGSGTLSGPLVRLVDHGQVTPLGNLVFIGNDHGTGSAFMPHQQQPDRKPPIVIATLPEHGARDQRPTTRIGIAFSDYLDFSSINDQTIRVLDERGHLVAGTYSLQNNLVNFAPSYPLEPDSTYQLQVVANGVKDTAGNALRESFESFFQTGQAGQVLQKQVDVSEAMQPALVSEEVLFSASIEGDTSALQYAWQFGDGHGTGFSDSPVATHRYQQPGHYQIILIISDGSAEQRVSFTRTVYSAITGQRPASTSTVAVQAGRVVVVNPDNGTLAAIDAVTLQKLWEAPVGQEPQTVALDESGRAWVTLKGEDALVIVDNQGQLQQRIEFDFGAAPHGVVIAPDQQFVLVSLSGSDELVQLDLNGMEIGRIKLDDPRAISIDGYSSEAWVTRFISRIDQNHELKGMVYRVGLTSGLMLLESLPIDADQTTTDSQDRARGVANYLFDFVISPDGSRALIPSKKDNVFRGMYRDGLPLEHDKTVRAILTEVDLEAHSVNHQREIDFDNRALARAALYSPLGDYVMTALQGSNRVIISDAYSQAMRVELETGLAPQGLAIDERGYLYVHNFMDRTLSVFDVAPLLTKNLFSISKVKVIPLVGEERLDPDVLTGKRIFYNADDPRMSRESYISCASCHVDGGQDGMVWDFTERGEGLRNTITLEGRAGLGHGNLHWTANFDEVQDFENDIRNGFGGTGFLTDDQFEQTSDPLGNPKSGLSSELDALARYVSSLEKFSNNPYRDLDASGQGKALFDSLGCSSCHSGENFTDGQRHVLGNLVPGSGQGIGQPLSSVGIETPTLKGLWKTAPYFHHGQALTLEEVLRYPGHGNAQHLDAEGVGVMVDFLKSL